MVFRLALVVLALSLAAAIDVNAHPRETRTVSADPMPGDHLVPAVDAAGLAAEGTLALRGDYAPTNDHFASAPLITIPIQTIGANIGATAEPLEPVPTCGGPVSSVWFQFVAPTTGQVRITTEGTEFDTTLALYQGPTLTTLVELACNNDDALYGGVTSTLTGNVASGQTYYIRLAGLDGATSLFILQAYMVGTPEATGAEPAGAWAAIQAWPNHGNSSAVWTGSEIIVWGGGEMDPLFGDGGRYNPSGDRWTPLPTTPALSPRGHHTAVWTGAEMIVWGGYCGSVPGSTGSTGVPLCGDGARYNPTTDAWTPLPMLNAPSPRYFHTAVWTGSEMIVWGGKGTQFETLGDGARYNPVTDSWTSLSTTRAPSLHERHSAVWTGTDMIVWGAEQKDPQGVVRSSGDGARYNPSTDTWALLSSTNAPTARDFHTAVWTGSEMIVWGGTDSGKQLSDGARYNPVADTWTTLQASGAPIARFAHTAVWTGDAMIVWGGWGTVAGNLTAGAGSGGLYDPRADRWTPVSLVGAPAIRQRHHAVWTGSAMIIWGGTALRCGSCSDGGRFVPGAAPATTGTTSAAP